jgi:transforming growth factor-beta-induced protein
MKARIFSTTIFLILSAAIAFAGNNKKDIVEVATEAGSFNTLLTAATKAGLVETLKSEGPFTVFAPTDEAFAKLPSHVVENLLKPENKEQLAAILTYHVVSGKVKAEKASKLTGTETVNGQRIAINKKYDDLFINDSKVISADVSASNGVIHVIDQVLLPSDKNLVEVASEAGTFNTLIAAVKAAGLADALLGKGPFTVLAPTDEAFAKLPEGTIENLLKEENLGQLQEILKYHVISGRVFSEQVVKLNSANTLADKKVKIKTRNGSVMINDAKVVATDINATNGVIHVINTVLIPSSEATAMMPTDIIELAIDKGVPLFNHGNAQACAAVYEVTAQALLSNKKMLNSKAKNALTNALNNIEYMNSYSDIAWELRRGLDKAHNALMQRMMSANFNN